jgi:hypothetical protein
MQEYRRKEREEPLSPKNLYSHVYRANKLDEALLRQLIPGRNVVVIRHSSMHDIDSMPLAKIRAPLHASGASCYADLLIYEIGQIIWPGKWTGVGPGGFAGEASARAMVGGSKLTIGYWFQVHRTPDEPMKVIQGKFSGRLPDGFPIVTNGIEDTSGTVERAANDSLRSFLQKVASTQ